MEEWNKDLENADGTKTPKDKWFEPDDDILPRPLSQERWNEVKNYSEEKKEKLRQMIREKDKYECSDSTPGLALMVHSYVDTSGVLE
jgi:hypothetical protein